MRACRESAAPSPMRSSAAWLDRHMYQAQLAAGRVGPAGGDVLARCTPLTAVSASTERPCSSMSVFLTENRDGGGVVRRPVPPSSSSAGRIIRKTLAENFSSRHRCRSPLLKIIMNGHKAQRRQDMSAPAADTQFSVR